MPEINTGLGWAANSDWLVSATGLIASITTIGGPDFPGQPIPKINTGGDLFNRGYKVAHNNAANVDLYVASEAYRDELCGWYWDGSKYVLAMLRYGDTSCVVTGEWFRPDGTSYRDGYQAIGQSHYYSDENISYLKVADAFMRGITPDVYYGPQFSSALEMCQAVVPTTMPFTKDNAGYAVACVARWKTQSNVIIKTPILISTDSSFTDMTDSSSTYNLAKLNILRQGVRFYMSFFDITDADPQTALPVLDLSGQDESPKSLEQVFAYIADLDHAAILVLESPDPYENETGASGEEGGDGEDQEDDPVEEETLPLPSVAGHGFCTIYVPSSQELNQMSSYLWGGSFDVSQVIKLFSNPMDSILGLSAVPVDLVGSPEQIYLGGVALTGITMPKYTGRTSVKVDFGTVTVNNRWGSYLDYTPYTDFSIYLPFIGIKPIKADDIMGKTISLMYAIDILSGGCVAYLRPAGGSVLYEWSGQCALQIPVTGRSYDNVFQSAMSVATAALAAVAAPASAPVLSGAVASAAVQAAATKPHIERSGAVNGITGFLGQLRPYLIRTIPEAFIPAEQNKFIGYPAYINVDLANVVGYNEVDSIHLENVTATGAELDEIETILKGGVIF